MLQQPWLIYAILSAVAAALVGIFAKVGMEAIDPTLATAVRSILMTLFLAALCAVTGTWSRLGEIHLKAGAMILLSGLAGAVSWLFYFKAIQVGTVSQVAPIDKLSMPLAVILAVLFLSDRPTLVNWLGVILMTTGAYLAARPR